MTHLPDSSIQPSLNEDLEPTGPQRLFQILVRVIGVTVAPNDYSPMGDAVHVRASVY